MDGTWADDSMVIWAFHLMWDNFSGMARLVNKNHVVLAGNAMAVRMGYVPGISCARVPAPQMHRGCKMIKALRTGKAQVDVLADKSVRGWLPVQGRQDLVIHFVLPEPKAL